MTKATWETGRRPSGGRIREILSGRIPFVITFGCLLAVNWGVAFWVIEYTYRERETAAFQLVNEEVRYAEQKIADLFQDADRTLLEARALYSGGNLRVELERSPLTRNSGDLR